MSTRKYRFFTMLVLLAIASLVAAACAQAQPTPAPASGETPASVPPVSAGGKALKIAFVGPTSGPAAGDGLPASKAAQLAVDQRNAAGGICGGRKVELVIHDDKADPKEGANVATLLCGNPEILAAAANMNSSVVLAGAPIYNECGLVQGDWYGVAGAITKAGPYTFRTIPTGDVQSIWVADWMVNVDGHKKIASLYENNDYGKSMNDVFTQKVKELGGEIVASEAQLIDQTDFSAVVSKFKAAKPEAVFIISSYSAAGYFLKQSADMEFTPVMYGADGIFSPDLINLAGKAAEGVTSNSAYSMNSTDPYVQNFVKSYRDAFGMDPNNPSGYTFDMTNLILDGLDATGCTRKGVMEWLTSNVKSKQGVTGIITFDENGDRVFDPNLFVKVVVKDGKWVDLK